MIEHWQLVNLAEAEGALHAALKAMPFAERGPYVDDVIRNLEQLARAPRRTG